MKKTLHFLTILTLAAGLTLGQSLTEFSAEDPMGRNTVQFKTTAPLEDIVGTTNKIKGAIKVDPNNLKDSVIQARFEVDLVSLKTGIDLRDGHMREQYLHTSRYPKAVFTLEKIHNASKVKLKPNGNATLVAEGSFELHGVSRKIVVPVNVTYLPESHSTMAKLPGNLLRISTEFDVKLADYDIERPQMVILKVGESAHVSLDVFATDANPQKLSMWMEQMKKMMSPSD